MLARSLVWSFVFVTVSPTALGEASDKFVSASLSWATELFILAAICIFFSRNKLAFGICASAFILVWLIALAQLLSFGGFYSIGFIVSDIQLTYISELKSLNSTLFEQVFHQLATEVAASFVLFNTILWCHLRALRRTS